MQRIGKSFQKPFNAVLVGMLCLAESSTNGAPINNSNIMPPASGARRRMLAKVSVWPGFCASMRNLCSTALFFEARRLISHTTSVAACGSSLVKKAMSLKKRGSLTLSSCKQGTSNPIICRGKRLWLEAASCSGVFPRILSLKCLRSMGTSKEPPASCNICTKLRKPVWSEEMPSALPRSASKCKGRIPSAFSLPPAAPRDSK
mmetsp:Transcript_64537/g.187023  ORF Transcript_64537/g.187023 Transcript_64537/m.187023 type:complete len:203 (-) Transcript_64537:308-916(-)